MDETLWCWSPERIAAVLTSAKATKSIYESVDDYLNNLHWSYRGEALRILWAFGAITVTRTGKDYENGTFTSYDWLE